MQQRLTIKQKIYQLILILFPILITQVTMFAINFFDTVMSGHASSYDLAGVAIGSSIWVSVNSGIGGIFMAVTPIVSQLIGETNHEKVSIKVTQGVYLALIIACLIIAVGIFTLDSILSLMNLETSVNWIARNYLICLSFGIPALFIYQVLRAFIDALGKTKISMIIALISLPINIALNYIFIFGKLGFPIMGGVGAGVASAITYWLIALLAFLIIRNHPAFITFKVFHHFPKIFLKEWIEQLRIGIPIGFAIFFETSIFASVTLFMSRFNTVTIAAHQAAMNFASMLYMVPLSISSALTIIIGFEVGAKRLKDARQYTKIGLVISVGLAFICGIFLLIFREHVARFYSKEIIVIDLIKQFIIFALFFQLSDAIAAPIQGTLRGYKDVNITLIMALFSYWIIGLPTGFYLSGYPSIGASGFWLGLILALAFNASGLFIRLKFVEKKYINSRKLEFAKQ